MKFAATVLSLFFLGLFLTSTAVANKVTFYLSTVCDNELNECDNIGNRVCCSSQGNAVAILKGSNDVGIAWNGGGCTNNVCSAGGAGTICCTGGGTVSYTGGSFVTNSKSSDPQSVDDTTKCTSVMYPNVFGFKNGTYGSWKIKQEDLLPSGETKVSFDSLRSTFESVPKDQKIQWLQEHGAKLT